MKEIKVLVIDDEVAEALHENLEDFKFQGAHLVIDAVKNSRKAKEKIKKLKQKKKFYDVLVTDMKMDGSEDKGLEIIEIPMPSLKIVLTAIATIENCVKCMKAGVFDYIDKNSVKYDPYERLKNSIKEGLEQTMKGPFDPKDRWVAENRSRLIKNHSGKFIAVMGGIVVDSDRNEEKLIIRVKNAYPFLRADFISIENK